MKRIKVGIIGQGRSGRNIHRHLFECCPELQARFDVVAVADPIPERTAPVNPGANPECRQYADYKEMLEDKNIELIVNASRSHRHVPIAIEAMEKGFNVVCEKPIANKVSEVDRAISKSKELGKFFAVFQQARFRPVFRKIFEIIQSGVLGEISMYKVHYNGFGRRWDWQTVRALNGGELLNTAPHPLDQIVELWESFGDSDPDVFCRLANVNNSGDAEDFVKLILTGKDHPIIDLEVTRQTHFSPYMYQVYGSNGSLASKGSTVEWNYFRPEENPRKEVRIATMEGENRAPVYCSEKLSTYNEKWTAPDSAESFDDWGTKYYLNIYDALMNGADLKVKLSQVRRQVAIIEECYRQNEQFLPRTVEVPEGIF